MQIKKHWVGLGVLLPDCVYVSYVIGKKITFIYIYKKKFKIGIFCEGMRKLISLITIVAGVESS